MEIEVDKYAHLLEKYQEGLYVTAPDGKVYLIESVSSVGIMSSTTGYVWNLQDVTNPNSREHPFDHEIERYELNETANILYGDDNLGPD